MKIVDVDGEEITSERLDKLFEKSRNRLLNRLFPNGIAHWNAHYAITHPWKILEYFFDEIKYAWQRVFRGWDDRVIWSIDWYLAKHIPVWVRLLDKQGVPGKLFNESDYDENYQIYPESSIRAEIRWGEILEKIAIGFESYIDADNYYNDKNKRKELMQKFNEGFDLFKEYFESLWD